MVYVFISHMALLLEKKVKKKKTDHHKQDNATRKKNNGYLCEKKQLHPKTIAIEKNDDEEKNPNALFFGRIRRNERRTEKHFAFSSFFWCVYFFSPGRSRVV